MNNLANKHALVTGASRGIGRGIAVGLAAAGATVAVHYARGKEQAEETVDTILSAGGTAYAIGADLADPAEIKSLFATIDQRSDKIDILVNNAGISRTAYIQDMTVETFDLIVATNMRGPYFVTQQAIKRMERGGRIIFVTSNSTRVAYPEVSTYGMTKAAIQNLTLSLAQQLGSEGITVNAVVPGVVDTEMNLDWLSKDAAQYVSDLTALGRLGTVEEIANVVSFLASPGSSWVTAQFIEASGGCRL